MKREDRNILAQRRDQHRTSYLNKLKREAGIDSETYYKSL
jgi:hypothetical protein